MSWLQLSRSAQAFRLAHIAIAAIGLGSVGYVWASALSGRRDRWLNAAFAALVVQGFAIVIGRGNCPLGPLQQRLGDPRPCFELVLPPRAAKAAFPILVALTVAGAATLAVRGRGR